MAGITFVKVIAVGPGWNKVLASDGETYTLKGDYNWRSNNPGNIEYGPFAISQGAIGSGKAPAGRARGFAIFPSYEAGQAARTVLQFETSSYKDKTVGAAIARYAPASDNNDVASYVRAVTRAAGVTADTKMSDLTPDQRAKFLAAQQRVEGFRPGTIKGETGKPVPAEVSRQFKGVPLPAADIPDATAVSPVVPPRRPDGSSAPPVPARRPETVGGVVAPKSVLATGSTVLTGSAVAKPPVAGLTPVVPGRAAKAPVAGLTKVVPGRAPAAAAVPAVPALGKTVQQIGQEADNGRLNGMREIQEAGPSTTPGGRAATVAAKPVAKAAAAPAAKHVAAPAAQASGVQRVNTEIVRKDGSVVPVPQAGSGGALPPRKTTVLTGGPSLEDRDAKAAAAAAAKKTGPLPAPAPLTFSKPVYKTVTVLNPEWKPEDKTAAGDALVGLVPGLVAAQKAKVEKFLTKRVLVTAAKPSVAAGQTAAKNAAIAAQNKRIAATNASAKKAAVSITVLGGGGSGPATHTPAGNLHPGASYDNNGNDMAHMPRSYQKDPANSNGGYR